MWHWVSKFRRRTRAYESSRGAQEAEHASTPASRFRQHCPNTTEFLLAGVLGVFSLVAVSLFFLAGVDIAQNLSPQGCRMSWMSPSYLRQTKFDTSWTPLASRYSLWLYREVGWDPNVLNGTPVLFIPGNAGSSRQVRSIASSASRQYYMSPSVVAPTFESGALKPLDVFTVEFNEDLSAFHRSTLDSEIAYTSSAISYILSLYPPNTSVIVMGHSMGGVVATALLPSRNISAIITMSTPHSLPPARFDSRIDDLYTKIQQTLKNDATPIVSICGGATDMLIPSESCILGNGDENILRRTVFTSALEGAWTGVGHQEMVWCHQVRWRVARAALQMGAAWAPENRARILDRWLRDGHTLPPEISGPEVEEGALGLADTTKYETLPVNMHLVLKNPRGSGMYLVPLPKKASSTTPGKFVLFVSQGTILPVSPQKPLPLRVTVFLCSLQGTSPTCSSLKPSTLKLIPNPIPGKTFPVPDEGSDESEGVVLYEATIPLDNNVDHQQWVGIKFDNADGGGWVVGGFDPEPAVITEVGLPSLLFGGVSVKVPKIDALRTTFTFPKLLSNALVVYRITPNEDYKPSCTGTPLPPLLMHTSHSSETHYFSLTRPRNHRILLHTHAPGPHILRPHYLSQGLNFTIYSSGGAGCSQYLHELHVTLDWPATIGRWASRYVTTIFSWSTGVAALVVFSGWRIEDQTGMMPSVHRSLVAYSRVMFRYLLPLSVLVSLIPTREIFFLGNKGESLFAPIAPLLLLIASGLVCVMWWVLYVLMWTIGELSTLFHGRRKEKAGVHRATLVSMCIIFFLISLVLPWQVAFLGSWLLHLYTCASTQMENSLECDSRLRVSATPPFSRSSEDEDNEEITDLHASQASQTRRRLSPDYHLLKQNNLNHNMHLLLLMTWLLPLAAPVLAVWVRTLATAGFTTPFDGDHIFINVAPFLVLVDFASWTPGALFERQQFERYCSVRWVFAVIAGTAFVLGSRRPYMVFDAAKFAIGIAVAVRIGRRYWGGPSWSSNEDKRG